MNSRKRNYWELSINSDIADQVKGGDARELMRGFFNALNYNEAQDPSIVAIAYADLIYRKGRDRYTYNRPSDRSLQNVSIAVSGQCRLEWLTRRAQLIGDTTTLTHYAEQARVLDSEEEVEPYDDTGLYDNYHAAFRCSDLSELGRWILDCRPLLEAGDVFYQPDIITERHDTSGVRYNRGVWDGDKISSYGTIVEANRKHHQEAMAEAEASATPSPADALLRNGSLIYRRNISLEKAKVVYPILKTDLPFVDETPMASFAGLAVEYQEPLRRARDSFRETFLSFEGALGSEKLETEILKFGVELRNSMRELDSQYRSMKRSSRFARIGASLGTVSATLALTHFLSPAAAIIGGGGGGGLAFLKALEDQMTRRHHIEERPFYFVWILQGR